MTAARIAAVFQLDPVMVLEERDAFRRNLRVAAYQVYAHDNRPRKE